MDKPTPKSIASTTSTVRGHSTYCEATGPIVREGFVAARVRAIQTRFDEFPQNLSHSPLIPCPVPNWLQITDHITPPQSLSTGRRKSSQKWAAKTRTPSTPSRSVEPKLPSNIANVVRGERNTLDQHSPDGAPFREKKAIVHPDPKLPIIGLPHKGWPPAYGKGYQNTSTDSGSSLHPHDSAADRLVSLVDRGWVGCDVFGKSYHGRPFSDVMTSSEPGQEALASDRHSQWESFAEEALPVDRHLTSKDLRKAHNADRAAHYGDFRLNRNSNFGEKPYKYRSNLDLNRRIGSESKADTRVDSSEYDGSQVTDRENSRPFNEVQAKARRNPAYFMDYNTQQSAELGKLSLSQEIDRHLSQWENTRAMSDGKLPLTESIPSDLQEQERVHTPSRNPRKEDHHLTTIQEDLKGSPLRSASWFSKLAGLRLALIDKAPIMQALSRRTSEPALGSIGVQYHDKYQDKIGLHAVEPGRGTEAENAKDFPSKSQPEYLMHNREDSENHPGPMTGDDTTTSFGNTGRPFHVSRLTLNQNEPSPTNPSSQALPVTSMSESEGIDVEKDVSDSSDGGKLSKAPVAAEHAKDQSKSISQVESASNSSQKSHKIRSTSPDIKPGTKAHVAPAHDTESSEAVPPRLKPTVITKSSDMQVKDLKMNAQWEIVGNGRGIKRVQVIVSLDGSDDLVIDAQILNQPSKKPESRIEEAEKLETEETSDYSHQVGI